MSGRISKRVKEKFDELSPEMKKVQLDLQLRMLKQKKDVISQIEREIEDIKANIEHLNDVTDPSSR